MNTQNKYQFEYLIEQAIRGNHVLFDHSTLTRILKDGAKSGLLDPLSEEEAMGLESHIEQLVSEGSLERKRAYLESLDSRSYAWVVKTYFNIVENNLSDSKETLH